MIFLALPVFSYYDVQNTQLKYALFDENEWQNEVVDDLGDVGQHSSLTVTPDKVQIGYYDAKEGTLKFASQPAETRKKF